MADKKEKKSGNAEALDKRVTRLEAITRKTVKALEKVFAIDIDKDGEVGAAKLSFVVGFATVMGLALCIYSFGVTPLTGSNRGWNLVDSTRTNDVFQISSAGAVSADGTVTAPTFVGALTGAATGDVVCDDITASGADTASLDINIPASTNAVMGTITYKSATTVANMTDADYLYTSLLNAYNSATAAVNYVYCKAIASDVTTATEDGSYVIGIEVNSTATDILTLDATGVTIVGALDATSLQVGGATGITTNQLFLSATGTTNMLVFTNGILFAVN